MSARARSAAALGVWLALAPACRSLPEPVPIGFARSITAAEQATPLGGSALELRREHLARLARDLRHLQRSLQSVQHRADHESAVLLGRFSRAYLHLHLAPLLAGRWQGEHPELMALDAGLRLAEIELLRALDERSRARRALEELGRRFAGREDLLVDYPIGAHSALGEALAQLRAAEED